MIIIIIRLEYLKKKNYTQKNEYTMNEFPQLLGTK